MSHQITLYGFGPTRSVRCEWTLLELGVDFDFIDKRELIGSDELRKLHPQAKLPAIVVDGHTLFESSAICTYLCDLFPDKNLLARPGSYARALHDQWTAFTLSEMEAYLWSNAKHQNFYPAEKRVPGVVVTNSEEFRAGAVVLNDLLADNDFIVANQFSVTDIVVSWALNWGRRMHELDRLDNISRYLDRLFQRPHCKLNQE
ncbi:MAG: glutathione S-transferase family protein [Gammaproteobacteria bacterium]